MDAVEVAEFTGMSRSWVYKATDQGIIPHVRIGRNKRYVRAEIEAWLEGARRAWRPGDSTGDALKRAGEGEALRAA